MDYFEATIARILEAKGYWVRENVRVALTKDVKKALGNPSMPRCEIDIVAYKPRTNALILFEVKSYLDSKGVQPKDLRRTESKGNRYKLLTVAKLQRAIKEALLQEYEKAGLIRANAKVRFGLAAGFVKPNLEAEVQKIADSRDWFYLGPSEIAQEIREFAKLGYENSPFVLTAKILDRNPPK